MKRYKRRMRKPPKKNAKLNKRYAVTFKTHPCPCQALLDEVKEPEFIL